MHNPFTGAGEANDAALAREALEGSAASLEALVRRHQPWIYNIACRMVFDPDEAQDVTQEILIKLITRLSSYDPERGAFRTWLYRVVANHVLTMKKARREEPFSSPRTGTTRRGSASWTAGTPRPEPVLAQESRLACITGMLRLTAARGWCSSSARYSM